MHAQLSNCSIFICLFSVSVIMEISFSRCVKDLGRLTSEELTVVFNRSCRSDVDKKEFIDMLQEFKIVSNELEVDKYEKKSKSTPKPKIRATKKNIVSNAIVKMRQKLAEYEQSHMIDEWQICFTVGKDYSIVEMADIKASHARFEFHCYSLVSIL